MGLFKSLIAALSAQDKDQPASVPHSLLGLRAVVLDFETSGLSPQKGDRAVWFATATIANGGIERGLSLAVAGADGLGYYGDPPKSVARVERRQWAITLQEAIASCDVVIAHNAAFDAKFALAECEEASLSLPDTPWLCTMMLSQRLLPQLGNHRLETCLDHFSIDPGEPHRADDDAFATGSFFLRLVESASDSHSPSLEHLLSIGRVVPGNAPKFQRQRSGSLSFNLLENGESDTNMVSLEEYARLISAGDWPICEGLTLNQIPSLAHREAHEADRRSSYDSPETRMQNVELLFAAGCPGAAWQFGHLPSHFPGDGAMAHYRAGQTVLRRVRDLEIRDLEIVRTVLSYAREASSLKDGVKLMLRCSAEFDEWLAGMPACPDCSSRQQACECLTFRSAALDRMMNDLKYADLDALIALELADHNPEPGTAAAAIAGHLPRIRTSVPMRWVRLLERMAARAESTDAPDQAMTLFRRSLETGMASRFTYDRLSLLAERAHQFDLAADVAEVGSALEEPQSAAAEKLRKRAARCRAKTAGKTQQD